ncbi:MAG: Flp pilus assembly complex ATPase component TadA [Propionibacteriaceae bacterium]|jgi:Flp pilus assembly CpaF family ATPase|nr:Flp pilus assembly complex ATPase component TadA [Propionibacteriaceae bacterium]
MSHGTGQLVWTYGADAGPAAVRQWSALPGQPDTRAPDWAELPPADAAAPPEPVFGAIPRPAVATPRHVPAFARTTSPAPLPPAPVTVTVAVAADGDSLDGLPWFAQPADPEPLSPVAAWLSGTAAAPAAAPAATPVARRAVPAAAADPTADPTPVPDATAASASPSVAEAAAAWLPAAGLVHATGPGSRRAAGGAVDWGVVAELREAAAQRLATWPGAAELDEAGRRDAGRAIVADLLDERTAAQLRAGGPAWDAATEAAMTAATLDMLFGLGRIQPLVDDPAIEDIYITGSDPTWVTRFGRPPQAGPPVADTDQELVDFLAFIASRADPPRAFSPAQPNLDLNLAGGARLSAQAWVTARPYATIRLHRHRHVTLADLVTLGTVTPVMATFLAAAVRAKLSLVVAGEMGAGKTTLLRALCAELDPDEPIGTFETDYELLLHEDTAQHHLVRAWEERQGHGDPGQAGRAGTFGLDEALFASFRQSLSRQIVGEVRGREIIPMIKAMQSGTGSLSTTHAQSARGAIDKLVTCALETGVTEAYALRALGSSVKLVVYVAAETVGGRRSRVVTEIVAVGYTADGLQFTDVFTRRPGSVGPARAAHLPDDLRSLGGFGFDLPAFNLDAAQSQREAGL